MMQMQQVRDLSELRILNGYWYIATPYTKYRNGLEEAYQLAWAAAEALSNEGIRNHSPIAATHPVAMSTGIDAKDHAFWIPVDRPFMDFAYGLVIVMFDGWGESYGIGEEIRVFEAAGKPILLLDPMMLGIPPAGDADDADAPVDNPKHAMGAVKVPFSDVPATVIAEMAVGMHEGSRKYGRHNYRVVGKIFASTYYNATLRHVMAWWEGEDIDRDSQVGLSHVTKAICSLMVLRDAMIQGRFADDRPPKAPPHWLAALNAATRQLSDARPEPVAPYTEEEHGLQKAA